MAESRQPVRPSRAGADEETKMTVAALQQLVRNKVALERFLDNIRTLLPGDVQEAVVAMGERLAAVEQAPRRGKRRAGPPPRVLPSPADGEAGAGSPRAKKRARISKRVVTIPDRDSAADNPEQEPGQRRRQELGQGGARQDDGDNDNNGESDDNDSDGESDGDGNHDDDDDEDEAVAGDGLSRWGRSVFRPLLQLEGLPEPEYFNLLARLGRSADPYCLLGDLLANDLDYATQLREVKDLDGALALVYLHARAVDQRHQQGNVHALYSKLAIFELAKRRQRALKQHGGRLTKKMDELVCEELKGIISRQQAVSDAAVQDTIGEHVRSDYLIGKRLSAIFVKNFGPGSLFYIAAVPGIDSARVGGMPMSGAAFDAAVRKLHDLNLLQVAEASGAHRLGQRFRRLFHVSPPSL